VIDLQNDNGSSTGTVISLDQGGAKIPITQISRTGAQVKLVVNGIGASYDGSLGSAVIDGTWTQSGQKFPLVLERSRQ
jgi:hypothetical protein